MYNIKKLDKGLALKTALFATGCAGIVAEFVLSTLATYFLGNAVFQWTIVMSIMLFAMGIGSRVSRVFVNDLLDIFILVEFLLSLLCAISAGLVYLLAAYTNYISMIIYIHAFIIGSLIGFEIPFVVRLNQSYEDLRINISGIMEKDYYGSLLGGLLFAFFALPCLGLTFTPIVLGSINFVVAALFLWRFFPLLNRKKIIISAFTFCLFFLIVLCVCAKPIVRYGEQVKYRDKIIYSKQTVYQKIVMTKWKDYYWLYINGQEQFSTFDEERYHEPLVHPAMKLSHSISNILIVGGGDGLALREVLKYKDVKRITLVDMDPAMTELAQNHPVLLKINKGSLKNSKVKVVNEDASVFIKNDSNLYGVIIVDLPDPDTFDLMHVYSVNFYRNILKHLIKGGIVVTQATSPFFSKKAFLCIIKTIKKAGFAVIPYHNHIPTMGEWGWVIGADAKLINESCFKKKILGKNFENMDTRFLNNDAMLSMLYFGKDVFNKEELKRIKENTEIDPVLYRYYLAGSWDMY